MSVEISEMGRAAVVTMRWTDRRNALGPNEGAMLADTLTEAMASSSTALVLTGEGAFCAGGDLRQFAAISAESDGQTISEDVYGRMQAVVRALRSAPMPTMAAIDGPAIGLGFDYALACDSRFVGPNGWLQQGWGRAGLIPGMGGIGLLNRLNGGVLWRLLATQERLGGLDAERAGLAERGDPTALDAALGRADELAHIPPHVLRHYCQLSRAVGWPDDEHFRESAKIQGELIASDAFRDFAQKALSLRE